MTQLDLQQKLEQAQEELKHQMEVHIMVCKHGDRLRKERDALQQQVNALAAENAAMKERKPGFTTMQKALTAFYSDDAVPEMQMLKAYSILRYGVATPATDAIKRQWMAEGADMVVGKLWRMMLTAHKRDKETILGVHNSCEKFAAQLRQPEEKSQ